VSSKRTWGPPLLLEVADLFVRYGKIQALRGVSLYAEEGEIVTVIGANGAGKTTTLNSISGLVRLSSGTVTLDGRPIQGVPAHRRVEMGICHVPEGRHVFPAMTVEENLQLGGFSLGKRGRNRHQADLAAAFQRFPLLEQRARQIAGTLSGGEQQMLAIGRGLMGHPRVLLMDEPSLGLAPRAVLSMFDALKDIRSQGITIVLVEQNAYQALRIADRAYILEAGEITRTGSADSLMSDEEVKHAYLGGSVTVSD
jgi:branched-chain amino acid transport system ATP-binding protein